MEREKEYKCHLEQCYKIYSEAWTKSNGSTEVSHVQLRRALAGEGAAWGGLSSARMDIVGRSIRNGVLEHLFLIQIIEIKSSKMI